MRATDIIAKKRDNQILTDQEINWFITEYTNENIPDYQASALLMAIYLNGMTTTETIALTKAMAHSGDIMDLSDVIDYAVDKHSSGGVGDKTSLVVLPLVASCGIPVAKMSGRGLGHSGGTLDKMEAIAGFRVNLSDEEFLSNADKHGLVLAGQTKDLAPADGKFYALRDVTATVASLPLIASSIMSKKIAGGANGIVLDVKAGNGAFMSTVDDARELAKIMVDIGNGAGRDVIAVISDMNQPLGCAVGNSLEVKEAIDTLKGGGPDDFREHCLVIAEYMLRLAGQGKKWTDKVETRDLLETKINKGKALDKFKQLVMTQGGDTSYIDDPSQIPSAHIIEEIHTQQSGYISQMRADHIAQTALELGAGREKKEDEIDFSVGVIVHRSVGDNVKSNDLLFTVHANDEAKLERAKTHLNKAVSYSDIAIEPLQLFYETLYGN